MDSYCATNITDSTQNELPVEYVTTHPTLRHWLNDPDLPRYPNTTQIDDLSGATNVNPIHTARCHTGAQQTSTILAKVTSSSKEPGRIEELQSDILGTSNDETKTYTVNSFAGSSSSSQRLTDHPVVRDFNLETSVGIGSHLDSPPKTHPLEGVLSSEMQKTFAIRPTDDPSTRRIGRGVFSDSFIRLFESTTVLYYCTFCNFISPSYRLWRKHERDQHLLSDGAVVNTSTQDLKCYFCDVDSANINERAEHIARHFFWQGFTKADWDAYRATRLGSQPSQALT